MFRVVLKWHLTLLNWHMASGSLKCETVKSASELYLLREFQDHGQRIPHPTPPAPPKQPAPVFSFWQKKASKIVLLEWYQCSK